MLSDELLDRYIAGEATSAESARVQAHLAANPGDAFFVEGLTKVARFTEPEFIAGREPSNVLVGTPGPRAAGGRRPARGRRPWLDRAPMYLAIAAALVVGFFAIKQIPNFTNTTQSASETKTYATTNGQRANITLADGSQVTLAPATTIRVSGRNVELQGEAVFTVTQHADNPFTVQAGNTITRVLGTTFGVRKYLDDNNARIVVSAGKVLVGTPGPRAPGGRRPARGRRPDDVILSVGDAATVSNGEIHVQHEANIANIFAWTSGRLVFDKIPLRDAIPDIERWYGITITADNDLLTRPVVTAIQTETPAEAIRLLAITLGARGSISGTRATLSIH